MTISRLPEEVLEIIFAFLDEQSLNSVERVCWTWSQIIVARFWFCRLVKIARTDDFLRQKFVSEGWSADCSDSYEINRRVYLKIKQTNWPESSSKLTQKMIFRCEARESNNKQVLTYIKFAMGTWISNKSGIQCCAVFKGFDFQMGSVLRSIFKWPIKSNCFLPFEYREKVRDSHTHFFISTTPHEMSHYKFHSWTVIPLSVTYSPRNFSALTFRCHSWFAYFYTHYSKFAIKNVFCSG